jgi:antitoxin component YwqK of YwqJK toxin-antitoxin module
MKTKFLTLAVIVFGMFASFAQSPKTERTKTNKMVKVTMYHENGEVAQTGFLKGNKLEGVWESFDSEGNKKAVGHYEKGIKTGKWFFWTGEQLAEVDYKKNRIENVIYWNNDRTASR